MVTLLQPPKAMCSSYDPRIALLAQAGLVYLHDATRTTDRDGAAERWSTIVVLVQARVGKKR